MTLLTTTISSSSCSVWTDEQKYAISGGDGAELIEQGLVPVSTAATDAEHLESETEDEEVKMSCFGDVPRGIEDSHTLTDNERVDKEENNVNNEDTSNSDNDNDYDEDDDNDSLTEEIGEGVVNFGSGRHGDNYSLVRPKATSPSARNFMSPLEEEIHSSDESIESSVGARGVALSLESESDMSDSSDDESITDEDEEKDIDDDTVSKVQEEQRGEGTKNIEFDSGYSRGELIATDEIDLDDDGIEEELSCLLNSIEQLDDDIPEKEESEAVLSPKRQIGVSLDRDVRVTTFPKTKRVLSFSALTTLNTEISIEPDSPKRSKVEQGDCGKVPLALFSIGPPVLPVDTVIEMTLTSSSILDVSCSRDSPNVSLSDVEYKDEDVMDRQLKAELGEHTVNTNKKALVPLLTLPDSPVMYEMNGDKKITICEWPSNLVIDSALTSAMNDIQPSAIDAIKDFVSDEYTQTSASMLLSPLLKGIAVNDN